MPVVVLLVAITTINVCGVHTDCSTPGLPWYRCPAYDQEFQQSCPFCPFWNQGCYCFTCATQCPFLSRTINLLKVDVERAELEVLQGVGPAAWPCIQQVVAEVRLQPLAPSQLRHCPACLAAGALRHYT
jgi:hypothetical protein